MTEDFSKHKISCTCSGNAAKIGLHLNSYKTEFISFNQAQDTVLKTVNNDIKKVHNFQNLGAWIDDTENDVKVRIVLA